jgi:hypothetical protein
MLQAMRVIKFALERHVIISLGLMILLLTACQGLPGSQGATGVPGPQGQQGVAGATGLAGATGPPGATGEQGNEGKTGATGEQGNEGKTGAIGAPGLAGENAIIRVESMVETLPTILRREWQSVLEISIFAPRDGLILIMAEGEVVSSSWDLHRFPVEVAISTNSESADTISVIKPYTREFGESYSFSITDLYSVAGPAEHTYYLTARNELGQGHKIERPRITAIYFFPDLD